MNSKRSIWWQAMGAQALVGVMVLGVACGGASVPGDAGSVQAPADMAVLPPDMVYVYPPEPYGVDEGTVVQDFSWMGYFSTAASGLSTGQTFGTVTFDQFRQSGAKYLFVSAGAFW